MALCFSKFGVVCQQCLISRCLLLDRANSVFWTRALNIPCPSSFVFPDQLPVPPALRALQLRNESIGQQLDGTTDFHSASKHLESCSAVENPLAKLSDEPACSDDLHKNDTAGNEASTHWYEIIADSNSINGVPDCGIQSFCCPL